MADSKNFFLEFPTLPVELIRAFKKSTDAAYKGFSREYGDLIESFFNPLLKFLVFWEKLLVGTPWMIIIGVICVFAYYGTRSYKIVIGIILSFFFVGYMGMWQDMMESMGFIIVATIMSIGLGIPLGVWMAKSDRAQAVITPILDFMQTLPPFVYLIPVVMLLGIGKIPGLISVIVYAIPPMIRLTNLGIREVDREILEAADSFGATSWQKLTQVQFPLALPTIFAGVNQTIMMALAMVIIASMIGVKGLGQEVLRAITNQYFTLGMLNEFKNIDQEMLFNIMSVNKIEIRNLYKIFGEKPLPLIEKVNNGMGKDELLEKHNHVLGLSDINLDIPNQSLQVIMGLSGSGKSTLIRHINRLIEPTSGSMMVDGQDVLTLSQNDLLEFRKNKTAMVFQKFALLPHKTVLENVAFGLYIKKIDTAETEKKSMYWIERVGLLGFEHRYPQQLSGGMQQRVGLARALANDPDILLMDEAFSALDPLIRKDMQDILLELQSELKKTVVFITHDLDEALKLGDRIAILKDGLMDQEGDAVDILLSPKTNYVKNFVEDVNRSRVLKARNIMQDASAISKDLLNGQTLKVKANDVIEKFIDRVVVDKPDLIEVLGENGSAIGYLSPDRLSEILRK